MTFLYYDPTTKAVRPKEGVLDDRLPVFPIVDRPGWYFACSEISDVFSDRPEARFYPTDRPDMWLELVPPLLEIQKRFCFGPRNWWSYRDGRYVQTHLRNVSMVLRTEFVNWREVMETIRRRPVDVVRLRALKLDVASTQQDREAG